LIYLYRSVSYEHLDIGELVLFSRTSRNNSYNLASFKGSIGRRNYFFDPIIMIRDPLCVLDGRPIISRSYSNTASKITSYVFGKERICDFLLNETGFDSHVDWIKDLEIPYFSSLEQFRLDRINRLCYNKSKIVDSQFLVIP